MKRVGVCTLPIEKLSLMPFFWSSKENNLLAFIPINQSAVVSYINQEWEYAPLLILHGNKDRVVPFEQSIQLFEACKKHDLEAQFYCVDEADHGGPLFYSEAVIDTIIDFLKCHIIE